MSGQTIGDIRLTGQEIRAGILNAETWPDIFIQNNLVWYNLGGCPLSVGGGDCNINATFNFFTTKDDAILEWKELVETDSGNVAATANTASGIDVAKLPYFKHPQTFFRPTLFAFEVTGHVMLGILVKGTRGSEIHIVNPWSMTGSQQLQDVRVLVAEKLKAASRNVIIIDVADEVEKYTRKSINLQEYEKVGFCTLWVGVIAGQLISQNLMKLQSAVREHSASSGSLLSVTALKFYDEMYSTLRYKLYNNLLKIAPGTCETEMTKPTAAAAKAIVLMAQEAATPIILSRTGGKRKPRRQTKRRPLFRNRWTRKQRNRR